MSIGPTEEPVEGLSDEALVERACAGDYRAFEAIVHRYEEKAYRLAWGLVKSEAEAEDVVQEAFLNIYRKLHTFQGQAQLGSWIYRVVVNAALSRLKKTRKQARIEEEGEPEEVQRGPASWKTQADEAAENVELRGQILAAIDELEPKYQAVFLLREVEGLSLADIAAVLELTEGTVKTRLHRGRLHLQAALEPYLGRNEDIRD